MTRFDYHSRDDEDSVGEQDPKDSEDFESTEKVRSVPLGRKMSRDDLQDLAKVSSDLLRRTLVSGFDIVKEVSKELPKEATQFISSRKEQVLQNVSKEFIHGLVNASMDRLFATVREHRLEVSFRIVRDKTKEHSQPQGDRNFDKRSDLDEGKPVDRKQKPTFGRSKRRPAES